MIVSGPCLDARRVPLVRPRSQPDPALSLPRCGASPRVQTLGASSLPNRTPLYTRRRQRLSNLLHPPPHPLPPRPDPGRWTARTAVGTTVPTATAGATAMTVRTATAAIPGISYPRRQPFLPAFPTTPSTPPRMAWRRRAVFNQVASTSMHSTSTRPRSGQTPKDSEISFVLGERP